MNDDSNIDIYRVIKDHRSKKQSTSSDEQLTTPAEQGRRSDLTVTSSDIPDIFFDEIIVDYRLNRIEILVLMYLYRRVWCRANLFRDHGISQMMSLSEMGEKLKIEMQEIYLSLRKLEELGFIKTIRSGQYFVRRYFQKEYDELMGQNYDDFDV